ncbi:FAD-dependent oxidoreductase [Chitinophaga japonensis]|uniref:FAD dependent oxidoreductase n=1 Tax=Chitinophaga japonensis TaxID=104662 RepID=A0A562TGM0_CHIJA|nr:FAD-dependent oxidoreductase [Chitinophaga japonensis]TWI92384.1 FAD dependent oxidoreductase [Chitinophaga japonensis]
MTARLKHILIVLLLAATAPLQAQKVHQTDVLIIGGGAAGTMAGIQAARMGVSVVIAEETTWLGGMLTAAGVSAIDGNHRLPAGLWGAFRERLYQYYGGPDSVATGWVSNTLFEPHVGNQVLKQLAAAERKLQVWYNTGWTSVKREQGKWMVTLQQGTRQRRVVAPVLIDATELGDVMAAAGAAYQLGMDSRHETGEELAPEKANDIVQDLTYVAILKDYGKGADKTIPRPAGYHASEFDCSCDVSDPATFDSSQNNCYKMMQYGRLPHNKYMINWPKCGNDIYLNLVESTPAERAAALQQARLHTLRFVYYLQTALGYRHLGLADDEFPTADRLPMIPYHRESRRLKGLVTLTLNEVARPYESRLPLYRTGIAVGDYPIDHHHLKNPSAPAIDFVKIKVPSYNVPMGSLIPQGVDGLIVTGKSISVTNIVNGATRLQPVVLQLGQAAGMMAALCVQQDKQPAQLSVREVQQRLLEANGYIMPFIDITPADPHFIAVQKIGATGIIKGAGVPYRWANQTWFYPQQLVSGYELVQGLRPYYPALNTYWSASGDKLTITDFVDILAATGAHISAAQVNADLEKAGIALSGKGSDARLNRLAVAVLLDRYLHPFEKPITISGNLE